MTVFIYLTHLTQRGSSKLLHRNRQMGVNQYIEKVEGLAKLLDLIRGAQVNKAMNSGWLGGQVVIQFIALLVSKHQGAEFTSQ